MCLLNNDKRARNHLLNTDKRAKNHLLNNDKKDNNHLLNNGKIANNHFLNNDDIVCKSIILFLLLGRGSPTFEASLSFLLASPQLDYLW